RWRTRIEVARRDARRLRGRYLELRYEDLVADPEPGLRAVCELCRLDYDEAMVSYHERAGERLAEMSGDLPEAGGRQPRTGGERLASHALARQPPTEERIGIWRAEMSAGERAEFESVAGDLLAELGYDMPS
ncbi:MAG: sulfotransferase, partial [Solirubrobacterales bacterium]